MYKGYTLKTDADFDNAMLFMHPVEVWQNGRIIDYGSFIQNHTQISVTINGSRYLKAVCEFRIR